MVTIMGNSAEFRFYKPDARQVCVVGDFVNWQTGRCPMHPEGNGEWILRISLPPGEYKFRYFADGQWFADYAAFGVEYGPFGFDSLVRIAPPKPARPAKQAKPLRIPAKRVKVANVA